MGEIADMHLDGTLCECCGEFLGEPVGYPRYCEDCQAPDDPEGDAAFDAEVEKWAFKANEYPVCPHCRKENVDWSDGLPQKFDGDSWGSQCGSCGKDYTVVMRIDVSFDTKE
jgi:hypothetical protein